MTTATTIDPVCGCDMHSDLQDNVDHLTDMWADNPHQDSIRKLVVMSMELGFYAGTKDALQVVGNYVEDIELKRRLRILIAGLVPDVE